jgi:hypothetical protein
MMMHMVVIMPMHRASLGLGGDCFGAIRRRFRISRRLLDLAG